MTDGYGNINWWGFSPALDLQEIGLKEMCEKLQCATPGEVNILLVGAGDVRHILKTISRRYRHSQKKLRFYVIESALELYARDIILMMVALELQKNMGLQDKTELFLEIYGNSLVRQQSNLYVEKMAHELIKMVTDFDYLEKKLPLFDLSQLKYKERDYLEGILKFWRNKGKFPFEISKCWDLRLRQQLGVRYDCRRNVYDWDYNMELIERGGSVVYVQQYKEWRDSGIAFQIREGTYDVPNRTLSSAMVFKLNGERFPRRGYWGDMVVSPFITFGIETEEKSFYKKQNNMHIKTAEDISEFNISSILHELTANEKYELPKEKISEVKEETKSTAKLEEIIEEEIDDSCEEEKKAANEDIKNNETSDTNNSKVLKNSESDKSPDSESENDHEIIEEEIDDSCEEEKKAANEDIKNYETFETNNSKVLKDSESDKSPDSASENDHEIKEEKNDDSCEEVKRAANKDVKNEETSDTNNSKVLKDSESVKGPDSASENDHEWLCLEDVKVTFLPLACVQELITKKKYQHLFNVIFFSNSMVHHLKPEVSQLFADRCSLILETALFMLDLKKDRVKEFVKKISGMAETAGCKLIETPDELQDSYIKFSFER